MGSGPPRLPAMLSRLAPSHARGAELGTNMKALRCACACGRPLLHTLHPPPYGGLAPPALVATSRDCQAASQRHVRMAAGEHEHEHHELRFAAYEAPQSRAAPIAAAPLLSTPASAAGTRLAGSHSKLHAAHEPCASTQLQTAVWSNQQQHLHALLSFQPASLSHCTQVRPGKAASLAHSLR